LTTLRQTMPTVPERRWFDLRQALPPEDAQKRTVAFIYGNILVLAAVVSATFSDVNGRSVVIVLGTAATTFMAHVLAGVVTSTTWSRRTLLHEARDSMPILTSGFVPAVLLSLALLGLPALLAVLLAEALLIVRIAVTGMVAARLTSEPASRSTVVAGGIVALVALVIVTIKVAMTAHF
jgi:hypothetical protein